MMSSNNDVKMFHAWFAPTSLPARPQARQSLARRGPAQA